MDELDKPVILATKDDADDVDADFVRTQPSSAFSEIAIGKKLELPFLLPSDIFKQIASGHRTFEPSFYFDENERSLFLQIKSISP